MPWRVVQGAVLPPAVWLPPSVRSSRAAAAKGSFALALQERLLAAPLARSRGLFGAIGPAESIAILCSDVSQTRALM